LPHRYSSRSAMTCTWSRRADASAYVMPYLRQQSSNHSGSPYMNEAALKKQPGRTVGARALHTPQHI
jgi:hypothetical protein